MFWTHFVVIGLSPPLAYRAIFSVMFSDVDDCIFAHVCVFLPANYWLYLCAGLPQLNHAARRVAADDPVYQPYWPVSPVYYCMTRGHVIDLLSLKTIVQTLLSEDRQCCESLRDAELGVRAVCAVWGRLETRGESGSKSPSDMTGEVLVLVRRVVLLCFSPHCDTAVSCLTNDMWVSEHRFNVPLDTL